MENFKKLNPSQAYKKDLVADPSTWTREGKSIMEGLLKQNQTARDNMYFREVLEKYGIKNGSRDPMELIKELIKLGGKN